MTGTIRLVIFFSDWIATLIGWLEPLLDRIAEDKRHVVYPQMPNIKDDTLEFRAFSAKNIQVGRFDWQLIFRWMELPEYINKTRKSFISPTRWVLTRVVNFALYKEALFSSPRKC